jgi:hypothetical protein
MKFIVTVLLTALLAFVGGIWFPWWTIAIAAFIIAIVIAPRPGRAFLAGFLGIFLLWALIALIIDIKNQSLLSVKIASVLPLGGNTFLLILVTALIGGLVGGFGAMTGSYLRKGY